MLAKKVSYSVLLFGLLFSVKSKALQLSGTYTINASASATSSNFQNFNSAITYLTGSSARSDGGPANAAPFGVSGPVVFNVAAGTYAGQVGITAIVGASVVNTITFDGGTGNASTRILSYSGTVTSYPVIYIYNSPYVAIKNLTLNALNSLYAFGVSILGTSNSCRISNCKINIPLTVSGSLSGIVVGGAISSTNGATRIDSVSLDSNRIYGGINGILFAGINSNHSIQNNVLNNYISDFGGTGIRLSGQNGIKILNNIVARGILGLYMQTSNNDGTNSIVINGNKIWGCQTALSIGGCTNAAASRGWIINNMFGAGTKSANAYTSQITSCNNWSIANNSMNYDTISSNNTYGVLNITTSTGISVINNILSVKKTGNPALPLYVSPASCVDTMDYNAFYREDVSDGALIYVGANYNSTTFKGGAGFNTNSVFTNPGFVNDTNLHMSSPCLLGTSLPYVTTDIDGSARNSPPNMGAHEVARAANDATVTALLSPVYPIAVGLRDVRVRVLNTGSNYIYNFNISYKLNGNAVVMQPWSGILAPCDTVSVLFTGAMQMNVPSGVNALRVYTANPNSSADGNMANDTLVVNFTTAMGGTYTIGPAPSSYTTFGAAIADLNLLGVGSAVRFMVKSGTYNESLSLTTPAGASIFSPVGFYSQANHYDSVIVNANGVYALNISGSYYTFNKITFNQLSTTTAGAVAFTGVCSFDTLFNCKLVAPNTTSTSSNVVYGSGITLNYCVVRRNTIHGGYNSFNLVSSSSIYSGNCIIDSNIIQNANNGMSIQYFTNLKFMGNAVNMNTNNNVLMVQNANTGYEFAGNVINVTSPFTATIYLTYNCSGTTGTRNKVFSNYFNAVTGATINLYAPYNLTNYTDFYNNVCILGFGFFQYGAGADNVRIYNNSITAANASYTSYYNRTGTLNVEVKNNVFSNTNGGVAIYFDNTPTGASFDYNNLYSTGTNLVSVLAGGTVYSSLAAWRAAFGQDRYSLSYRPGFTNAASNLQPNTIDSACWSLNGRGMPVAWIAKDINGNVRSQQLTTGATDIGAYEFTPAVNPPRATAAPATPAASSTQHFTFGSDTIASVAWGASVPSSLNIQMYSGIQPPQVGNGTRYLNAYWNMIAPAGTYAYSLKLHFKPNWTGTVPSIANMVIAQSNATTWNIASPVRSIDSANSFMTANGLTQFSYFTGTDATIPLPVEWMSFTAQQISKQVRLDWSTATELNNKYFEVERSTDEKVFEKIGVVKGNGTTNSVSNYRFTDAAVLDMTRVTLSGVEVYYRLKQVDHNGTSHHSDVRTVRMEDIASGSSIFPNPATNEIFISNTHLTGITHIEIFDLTGRSS